jgi:hypothetical protein
VRALDSVVKTTESLLTIKQLMAGMTIERPSWNVSVDETFKKAPQAKSKGTGQNELGLQANGRNRHPDGVGWRSD